MMLFLMLDVSLNSRNKVFADCESAISSLPFEEFCPGEFMVRQVGRGTFDVLHQPCNGEGGWKTDEEMEMIGSAPKGEDDAFEFLALIQDGGIDGAFVVRRDEG